MKSTPSSRSEGSWRRAVLVLAGALLPALLAVSPASAHAFGASYDLPLPLAFYLVGAAGAVALSFVVMALVFRTAPERGAGEGVDLLRFAPARLLLHPWLIALLQAISVGLFLLVLAAGLFGSNATVENFAPAFVWIIWWVGFAYVAALVGNLWPVVNPWSIVFAACQRAIRLCGWQGRLDLGLAYPERLGVWPAIVLFALFAWFELIYDPAKLPRTLGTLIVAYSGLTWLGMLAFGREPWLAKGEAFSLAFGVFGRFAPLGGPRRDDPDGRPSHWYLRPYGRDLVVERPCSSSMVVFVLLMLSTVTFDGFKETPVWSSFSQWFALDRAYYPLRLAINGLGLDFLIVLETVVFLLVPLLFFIVYLIFSSLSKEISGSERRDIEIAGLFVFSLVPIAIAYHLAHYLSYLLVTGQLIFPLASDPFGFGWDLLGTADYRTNIGIIGAKFVWYTAVVAIVVGHVLAVGVAHFVALRVFPTSRTALRSQYPLLVLMIGYTMVSLWILSQPIVERPDYKTLRAPSGALTLAPEQQGEICLDVAAGEEFRYSFRSKQPLAFDIHYHDGFTTQYPLRLSDVAETAASFTAELDQSYCLLWSNPTATETRVFYQVTRP